MGQYRTDKGFGSSTDLLNAFLVSKTAKKKRDHPKNQTTKNVFELSSLELSCELSPTESPRKRIGSAEGNTNRGDTDTRHRATAARSASRRNAQDGGIARLAPAGGFFESREGKILS